MPTPDADWNRLLVNIGMTTEVVTARRTIPLFLVLLDG